MHVCRMKSNLHTHKQFPTYPVPAPLPGKRSEWGARACSRSCILICCLFLLNYAWLFLGSSAVLVPVIAVILVLLLSNDVPLVGDTTDVFWQHRARAEAAALQGDRASSKFHYGECLRALGCKWSVSERPRNVHIALLCWHNLRHMMNKLPWCSSSTSTSFRMTYGCKQAIRIYHELQKLYITDETGFPSGNDWAGVTFGLRAVHLAEAMTPGTSVPTDLFVEIYATLAFQVQLKGGRICRLLARYFLSHCHVLCKSAELELPVNLIWLAHPIGYAYFGRTFATPPNNELATVCDIFQSFNHSESKRSSLYYVTACFKRHMLEKLAHTLLSGSIKKRGYYHVDEINGVPYADVVEWINALNDACRLRFTVLKRSHSKSSKRTEMQFSSFDELCVWWSQLMCSAIELEVGRMDQARTKYIVVKDIPPALRDNQLALALGHAFCARKVCLENTMSKEAPQRIWLHCMRASEALSELPVDTAPSADRLREMIIVLAYDWVLLSILESFEAGLVRAGIGAGVVCYRAPYFLIPCFQRNLMQLRRFKHLFPCMQGKLLIYETGLRLLTVVNPVQTQLMLERCLRISKAASRQREPVDGQCMSQLDCRKAPLLKHLYGLQFAGAYFKPAPQRGRTSY